MLAGRMRVSSTTSSPSDSGADTLAIGVFDGETVAHDVKGDALQRLIDAGEGRTALRHDAGVQGGALHRRVDRGEGRPAFRRVAVELAADRRWVIVGLGPRSQFDAEKAR